MKNIKSNRLKRSTKKYRNYESFARWTMWGLWLVTVMGLVYASNNITDITDSVTTWDTITADWFNNINSILVGSDTHKLGVTQSPSLATEGVDDEQLVSKAYVDAKTSALGAVGYTCTKITDRQECDEALTTLGMPTSLVTKRRDRHIESIASYTKLECWGEGVSIWYLVYNRQESRDLPVEFCYGPR